MNRDYKNLLPQVLKALYPDAYERNRVKALLSSYGKESYHQEPERVHLGILKLVSKEPEKLETYIQLACSDFRDLLCAAEYYLTSPQYKLSKISPEKYAKLEERERTEYDQWLSNILSGHQQSAYIKQ